MHRLIYTVLLLLCLCLPALSLAAQDAPNDQRALAGITTGKAIFDISASSTESLQFYLKLVKQTIDELKAQGVTADFVVSLRGAAVSIVSKDSEFNSEQDAAAIQKLILELKQKHVYFEACNIAEGMFDVEKDNLFDGVVLVGNTLISLLGYQTQGYAIVPLM
jgi:intracellular sulfur oxidation DsrE/DsrF family protein